MSEIKFANWPNFSRREGEIVKEVLLSNKVNYWTGDIGKKFEREFAAAMECNYSIAVANGTVALDLALMALNIGEGDEVIVTPRSFIASASAIHNSRATPVFADVDLVSQNITAESINAVLTDKTKAIVCVHLAGWPCDMRAIKALAEIHGIKILEDCAQAHGAKLDGESVGGLGDIGAWSFCQDKIMTTGGEGGMITTNNAELFEKMWSFKDHGKNRYKMENPAESYAFKFVHDSFGSNLRLTEMQSALGIHQLGLLDDWSEQRKNNALYYYKALSKFECLNTPMPPENIRHAYYKYYFFVDVESLAVDWDRDRIVEEINLSGGRCFSGSCPEIYLEQAFVTNYGAIAQLPNARVLGLESLMVQCHPGITVESMRSNINIIADVLSRAVQ